MRGNRSAQFQSRNFGQQGRFAKVRVCIKPMLPNIPPDLGPLAPSLVTSYVSPEPSSNHCWLFVVRPFISLSPSAGQPTTSLEITRHHYISDCVAESDKA